MAMHVLAVLLHTQMGDGKLIWSNGEMLISKGEMKIFLHNWVSATAPATTLPSHMKLPGVEPDSWR